MHSFLVAAVVALSLSGVAGHLRGERHVQRRLDFDGCNGSSSEWVSEGDVTGPDGGGTGDYQFVPGSGSSSRAEMKRTEARSSPNKFNERLSYSGYVQGLESDTGIIIFQYHRDGDGSPSTAAKVYLDSRYRDDDRFDVYLRCKTGSGDDETYQEIQTGLSNNGRIRISLTANKKSNGELTVTVNGSSESCDLSGFGAAIYPKFGAYNQGEGSYGNVVANFDVSSYSCSN